MTEAEAYREIESWLLVPVEYESVLPALAVVRSASDFDEYADRVAQADFKPTAAVIRDVDAWIEAHKNDRPREVQIAEKLDTIAGKKGDTARRRKDVDEQFNGFVQKYAASEKKGGRGSSDGELVKRCPNCGKSMVIKEVKGNLTGRGIFVLILFFLFIGPFCIIPFLMGVGRERKTVHYCNRCRTQREIR